MNKLSKIAAGAVSAVLVVSSLVFTATAAQASTAPDPSDLATARTQILNDTNAARAQAGLPPVVANTALNAVAQDCSLYRAGAMSGDHCWGYEKSFPTGWYMASENVGSGQYPTTVVNAWMNSDTHRANILDPKATDLGIGMYYDDLGQRYFTQNFAGYATTKTIPAVTTGLTATAGTNSDINLAWAAPVTVGNSPVTSYEVRYTAGGNTKTVQTGSDTTSFNLTGLNGGVAYTVDVRAVNAVGNGYWSNQVTATPLARPTVTASIANLTATTATLNWTVNNGGSAITKQVVYVNGAPVAGITTDARTFALTGLTRATLYNIKIVATNSLGDGEVNTQFTTNATVPTPVTNLKATGNTDKTLKVSWNAPADNGGAYVSTYIVTVTKDGNEVANQTVTATTATLSNIPRGGTYTVTVVARNAVGVSSDATQTVTTPTVAPTAPRNVDAVLADEQYVTVTWGTPTDNGTDQATTLSYQVQVFANGSTTPVRTVNVNGTTASFDSTVIESATNYTFTVSVKNSANSAYSPAVKSNTVEVPRTPTAPDSIAAPSVTATTNTVTVGWVAPDNGGSAITGYTATLFRNGNPVEVKNVDTDTLNVTFNGLTFYTDYTVAVTATNPRGTSEPVETFIRTKAEKPGAVTGVTATLMPNGSVLAGWDSNVTTGGPAFVTYKVQVLVNGEAVFNTSTGNTSVLLTGLPYNAQATLKVTVDNGELVGDTSSTLFDTVKTASEPVGFTVTANGNTYTVTFDNALNEGSFPASGYSVTFNGVTKTGTTVNPTSNNVQFDATEFTPTLVKGQSYTVTGYITTGAGIKGAVANDSLTIPTTAPSVARNIQGQSGPTDKNISVTWDAPADNGGVTTTLYDVQVLLNGDMVGSAKNLGVRKFSFTGNHNTTYQFAVTAKNSVGSAAPATVTYKSSATMPGAPADVVISQGITPDMAFTTFVSPENIGGSPITGFVVEFTLNGKTAKTVNVGVDGVVPVFTGLVPNDVLSARVAAVNAMGQGAWSASTVYTAPVVAPGKVSNLNVKVTAGSTTVTWSAAYDGGSPSTLVYDVTFTRADGVKTTVQTSNLTVTTADLTMFGSYTVTVEAKNIAGNSGVVKSAEFKVGYVAPNAPASVTATSHPTDTTITASWVAPVVDPAQADYVSYRVNLVKDGKTVDSVNTILIGWTFTGLTRGEEYKVTVATVLMPDALPDLYSPVVTSNTTAVAATTPDAVTGLKATVNGLKATISWVAPEFDGGARITGYNVTVNGKTTLVTTGTELVVDNLTPVTSYQVTVEAVNNIGVSPETVTDFTTPVVAPKSVTGVKYVNGVISWVPSGFMTGTDETYTVTVTNQTTGLVDTFDNITGVTVEYDKVLTPGTQYKVAVVAVNSAGTSVEANMVYTEPVIVSDAPTGVTLTVKSADSVTASWTAPAYTGGGTVSEYIVTVLNVTTGNSVTVKSTGTSTVLTGLALGSEYTVTVQAVNEAGNSVASAQSNSVRTQPKNLALLTEEQVAELIADGDLEKADAEKVGNHIVVTLPGKADAWFAGVAHSTPTLLGWAYGNTGELSYSIDGLEAGTHTFVLYDEAGDPVGYARFVVEATPVTPPATDNNKGTDTTKDVKKTIEKSKVVRTGVSEPNEFNWIPPVAAGIILGAFVVFYIARRRRLETETKKDEKDKETV